MFHKYDTYIIPSLEIRVIVIDGPLHGVWDGERWYLADINGQLDWYLEDVINGLARRAQSEQMECAV